MVLSQDSAFVILCKFHNSRYDFMNLPECNVCMELFRAFPDLQTTFLGLFEEIQRRHHHAA